MADELILVDTSVLIDYYRKTDKSNSVWVGLVRQSYKFAISAITKSNKLKLRQNTEKIHYKAKQNTKTKKSMIYKPNYKI